MFSQYFGHYLLNRNLITREQLTDALAYQQSVHVKFGVIAIDKGYMTASQVEEVHEKQKQADKRFGEIAVEIGYLTDQQVDSLITDQKPNHLLLAQALCDRNYMTIEQFGTALNEYKEEFSLSDEQFESIKNGSIDLLIENILKDADVGVKDNYRDYLTLFIKNMIRFIDDHVYADIVKTEGNQQGKWLVHQQITGESPLFTVIAADEEVFLHIASKFAEEEITETDELAKASVSEFLNLHNGIYLVNMSNWGIELTMEPQEITENAKIAAEDAFIAAIHTSRGSIELILSDQRNKISIDRKASSEQPV